MRELKLKCTNPQCRLTLVIPEEAFGQRVRCGGCGHSFVVPIPNPRRSTKKQIYRKAS